ncbi:hypothetical protein JOQ06_028981, partial [Pogonophryne albipinna]
MQIIRDHLMVPDTGRAKLSSTSQRQPSNTLCSYHPDTHTLSLSSSPPPPGLPPRPSVLGEDPRPTVSVINVTLSQQVCLDGGPCRTEGVTNPT